MNCNNCDKYLDDKYKHYCKLAELDYDEIIKGIDY
jgi:hypothetical protein